MRLLHPTPWLGALAPLLAALCIALAWPLAAFAGPNCGTVDTDGDGVFDLCDNCINVPNGPPGDCDGDQDGYGNACDGDCDNGGTVTAGDFSTCFVPCFIGGCPIPAWADFDCGGTVSAGDFSVYFLPQFTQGVPGPSGWSCAGTIPCLGP